MLIHLNLEPPMTSTSHQDSRQSAGPLSGLRVLDLTLAMAGPLATSRMGDLGADVVKVESPTGDFSRHWPIQGFTHGGESSAYLMLNRSKRGICLDLKTEEGRNALYKLAETADVVIQNFRPAVAARLKIDYDTLHSINPKLVYVSISGYGESGVMSERPGQDLLLQAFSGMTFNAGTTDGLPHPAPVYIVDTCASHLAVQAALSGYIEAQRTGVGRHLKVTMLAAALEIQIQEFSTYLNIGRMAPRSGHAFASAYMEPPYGIYRTADGFVAIAQARFEALAEVLDEPEYLNLRDAAPGHDQPEARAAWRDLVGSLTARHLLQRTTEQWVDLLTPHDIWINPVMDYAALARHPQVQPLLTEIEHPSGNYRTVRPAIDVGVPTQLKSAPRLGEHTKQVLAEHGIELPGTHVQEAAR